MYRDNTNRQYDYEYFEYLRSCAEKNKREQAFKQRQRSSYVKVPQRQYTQQAQVQQAYTKQTQTKQYTEEELNKVSSQAQIPENKEVMDFLQSKFWLLLIILCALPVANSTVHNIISIVHNIGLHSKLSSEKKNLELANADLQNKLKDFRSQAGIKRAIKEEINLIENNEIVIKIVD